MHYGLWLRERGIPPALPYFSPHMEEGNVLTDDGAWALPAEYHVSRWVADETIAYLHDRAAREPDRPWYACVNFPDPHPPFVAPAPWHGRHADTSLPPPVRRPDEWEGAPSLYQATLDGTLMERGWHDHARPPAQFGLRTPTIARTPEEERRWRTHMDMTALTDHHIGRILDTLDALDQTRDTLVVFTSDHGDYLGDHYLWAKGGSHYDGAVRVPFVVRWPGTVPAGMRSDALQSLVDIAPTFLAAAGIEPHPEMQGIDALPTWGQPDRPMRDAVLIEQRVERGLYVNTRITARTRLSVHSLFGEARDELEYYDFATDPGELWNRAGDAAYAALVQAELAALLRSRLTVSGPWQERTSFA
jgi:uncharacterized sulfatase